VPRTGGIEKKDLCLTTGVDIQYTISKKNIGDCYAKGACVIAG
jgi:hypothetical protein